MVSLETASRSIIDQPSSPRISFSAEFLDSTNFISINPTEKDQEFVKAKEKEKTAARINAAAADNNFEFLSNNNTMSSHATMLTADELFFEGKLLPFWQMQQSEKLHKISLKTKETDQDDEEVSNKEEQKPRVWFLDDDPSPRPPKCTVLWKELLRLKKQRAASSLSPSSSSSSTSSSSSSLADIAAEEGSKESSKEKQNAGKRMKKGLERTRSATIRIRPMINVPICTSQLKSSSALPPLFSLKKGRLER